MNELAEIKQIRQRIKLHSELETELMKAGPMKAEKLILQQERIQEYYFDDVMELLETLDDLQRELESKKDD